MTDAAKKIVRTYGPWRGVNESPAECGPDQFEDAWNVEFDGDTIRTRGGREKIYSAANIYPSKVLVDLDGLRTDGTTVCTDGDASTGLVIGNLDDSDELIIGFSSPVNQVDFTVSVANAATATLSVYYYSAVGWILISPVTDITKTAGKAFAVSGSLSWAATATPNWVPVDYRGEKAFFLRIVVGSGQTLGANTKISSVSAPMTSGNTLLNAANGLYQWRCPNGERRLIIGMDHKETRTARLFYLDRSLQRLRPMTIRGGGLNKSGPDASWEFATLGDFLVACNGYVLLHSSKEDPSLMVPFEQSRLVSGSIQTNSPPADARHLCVYNGCLYITTRKDPNRVRISNTYGSNDDLDPAATGDYSAPMGGANIWNATAWFVVSDSSGSPITGMSVVAGRMVVFTARSTHISTFSFDGTGGATVIDDNVGCTAPASLCSTSDAIFFLGPGGVYANTGGRNELISDPIRQTFKNLNQNALRGACAAVYRKSNQYRLCVPAGSDSENNLVLVFDYRRKTWTKFGTPPWLTAANRWLDYKVKLVHSARDDEWGEDFLEVDYDGYLWLADYGNHDDTQGILSLLVTHRMKFDDQGPITLRSVKVGIKTRGGGDDKVSIAAIKDGETWKKTSDNEDSYTVGQEVGKLSQLDDDTADQGEQVFGTATYEKAVWTALRYVTRGFSFGNLGTGRYYQIILHNNVAAGPTSIPFDITGMDVELTLRPGRR